MKLFPLHILIKDLSYLIIYFVLMKYNITGETYLPKTIRNFPGATTMTFPNIFLVSFLYSIIPLCISLITYFLIVRGIEKILPNKSIFQILLIGLILTSTTPLAMVILNNYKFSSYKYTENVSWFLCFIISISTYYFFNRKKVNDL
jgi:magnesium-transporting ATPase (P-type)